MDRLLVLVSGYMMTPKYKDTDTHSQRWIPVAVDIWIHNQLSHLQPEVISLLK